MHKSDLKKREIKTTGKLRKNFELRLKLVWLTTEKWQRVTATISKVTTFSNGQKNGAAINSLLIDSYLIRKRPDTSFLSTQCWKYWIANIHKTCCTFVLMLKKQKDAYTTYTTRVLGCSSLICSMLSLKAPPKPGIKDKKTLVTAFNERKIHGQKGGNLSPQKSIPPLQGK